MTGKVINRLNKIALGEIKGAPISVQISAALGLLKKTMPDLSHVENAGGRTLDEIMFAAAVLAKTLPNDGWKLPSTPPPPIDLEALPLKLLDEADGGE